MSATLLWLSAEAGYSEWPDWRSWRHQRTNIGEWVQGLEAEGLHVAFGGVAL